MKKIGKKTVIGLLVLAVFVGAMWLIPGMANSLRTLVFGETVFCAEAPYNPYCTCTIDREKVWDGRFVCITHSPKSSIDCDWCNGQCVEWGVVWDEHPTLIEYNEYCVSRAPVPGYACTARETIFGNLECVGVPAVNPEGFITFCTDAALEEVIEEWQGTDDELVSFLRSGCPTGELSPLDLCELRFSGGSGTGYDQNGNPISFADCVSDCYDDQGILVGGHIMWESIWYPDTNEVVFADGGWHETPTTPGYELQGCITGV